MKLGKGIKGVHGLYLARTAGENTTNQQALPYTGNRLLNTLFEHGNYPTWTEGNGVYKAWATEYEGTFAPIRNWIHFSPIFNDGYGSFVGNFFLDRFDPYELVGYVTDAGNARVMKMYGSGYLWDNQYYDNEDADRASSFTGYSGDHALCKVVSNSTVPLIDGTTTMSNTGLWSRHEWTQRVYIPTTAASVTVGARVKISADDKLRPLNFVGISTTQVDSNDELYVNYTAIGENNPTYTLPTGTLTTTGSNNQGKYNWNGLSSNPDDEPSSPPNGTHTRYHMPETVHVVEHAFLDEDNFEEFQLIEFTFVPVRSVGETFNHANFNIFFAENASNMNADLEADGELTGGFQVFDPYVKFNF
jgi:hypothetical protein